MRFFAAVAALMPIGLASAATFVVKVGENGTLTYDPPQITGVQNGDTVAFQFLAKNHTVTQSTFAAPCQNISDNGLDSGFQFIPPNTNTVMQYSFNMTNVTGPLWFYCRQANHCQQGMVFAVNPTAEKTFQAFQAAAMSSTNPGNSTAPPSSPPSSPPATVSSDGSQPTQSGSSSASGSPSTSSGAPAPTNSNAAGHIKAGSAAGILLTGVGLVAGLVL